MAIEYLARQQGNQQTLINELLQREPGTDVRIIEKVIKPASAKRQNSGGSAKSNSKFKPSTAAPTAATTAAPTAATAAADDAKPASTNAQAKRDTEAVRSEAPQT